MTWASRWSARAEKICSSQRRTVDRSGLPLETACVQRARDSMKDFPMVTPNDLRHTQLGGVGEWQRLALARMLGHEDPSLTLRTYADPFDSDLVPCRTCWISTARRHCDHQLPSEQ